MKEFSNKYISKYQEEILENLSKLISFQSVRSQSEPSMPFGKAVNDALEFALNLCNEKGLKTVNKDGYYGYCEYGSGQELVTILVHLDIVPAGEGWNTDPFCLTEADGKLIGRGALDDKGPAIACIYALDRVKRTLEAEGKKPRSRVRIVFGTDEETSWADMKKYREKEEPPTCGFTADADFPVVYAEKGILTLHIRIPNEENALLYIKGGTVTNAVPNECTAIIKDGQINYTGKAAHACEVEKGENAISAALLDLSSRLKDSALCNFWETYLGRETNGQRLNCLLQDEISGALSLNIGTINMTDSEIEFGIDIRFPVTYRVEEIRKRIVDRLKPSKAEITEVSCHEPICIPKKSKLIQTLVESYGEYMGEEPDPVVTGGATYARALPNIAAFGPVFPDRECSEHQPNEYILKEDFFKIIELYYKTILKLVL